MANPQINNYDLSKIFVLNNRYATADYTNPTSDDIELPIGTVMGRVSATNKIIPCKSTASDGSQYPIGILADTYGVDYVETAELTFCTMGDVVQNKIVFNNGTDTVATAVSGKTMKDMLQAAGINLVGGDQLTGYDNQ